MNKQIIHDERCIARIARQQAFDLLWPRQCKQCLAWGGQTYRYDPSPPGVSLGPGFMEDFDPCPECIERGICPRCAQPIGGPKWRPINLRERASNRLFGLARVLQHARPAEWLLRQAWWRAAALFRENPTVGTWTIYHPIDKLWNHVYDKYSRPSRASRVVFAVQAWLERGVYDERPCYHCGWNWGKHPDDGRELGDCECWIPGWEEEQDKAGIPLVQAKEAVRNAHQIGSERRRLQSMTLAPDHHAILPRRAPHLIIRWGRQPRPTTAACVIA